MPKLLCDTTGMTRERWLECRMHGPDGDIPYTIGGSDVAAVLGVSPWVTPLELWRIKKGLMQPDDTVNAAAKAMGLLMEPIVAQCYAKATGNTVIEDTGLYQHTDYPYALANLDFRINEAGREGVLECKTTTYHKAGDWADDQIPYHYEVQVRFYLAVMDLDFADICCMWGFNAETDMAIRRVNRDRVIEAYIFEQLDAFITSLHSDLPPDMGGVKPVLHWLLWHASTAPAKPDCPPSNSVRSRPMTSIGSSCCRWKRNRCGINSRTKKRSLTRTACGSPNRCGTTSTACWRNRMSATGLTLSPV
ncbi:MAG: YqaJ viral recombinase family protein [Oscillospiraceae bacterium]|nr:YqaJ viral recombinase family protein [Oscillospiraceae bacterium]